MSKPVQSYQCPECGLHYEDELMAQKCESWCKENKSCNLEITKFSVEIKRSKL